MNTETTPNHPTRRGAALLVAAALLAVQLVVPSAFAAPATSGDPTAGATHQDGAPTGWVSALAGLISGLIDPWLGGGREPADAAAPTDLDKVGANSGNGWDPNGVSPSPPGGPGKATGRY